MLLFLFLRYKFLTCKNYSHNHSSASAALTSNNIHLHSTNFKNSSNNKLVVPSRSTKTYHQDEDFISSGDETMDVTMLSTNDEVGKSRGNNRSRRRRQHVERPCSCLLPLIRFWGILTAIGKFYLVTQLTIALL